MCARACRPAERRHDACDARARGDGLSHQREAAAVGSAARERRTHVRREVRCGADLDDYLRRAREPERVGFVEPHHRADRVAEPHGAARLRAPVRGRECIAAARQRGALRARDEQWRAATAGLWRVASGAREKGGAYDVVWCAAPLSHNSGVMARVTHRGASDERACARYVVMSRSCRARAAR